MFLITFAPQGDLHSRKQRNGNRRTGDFFGCRSLASLEKQSLFSFSIFRPTVPYFSFICNLKRLTRPLLADKNSLFKRIHNTIQVFYILLYWINFYKFYSVSPLKNICTNSDTFSCFSVSINLFACFLLNRGLWSIQSLFSLVVPALTSICYKRSSNHHRRLVSAQFFLFFP